MLRRGGGGLGAALSLAALLAVDVSCGGTTPIDMGKDPDFIWWTNLESGSTDDWTADGPMNGSIQIFPQQSSQQLAVSTDYARSGHYSLRATITTGGFFGPSLGPGPQPVWVLASRLGSSLPTEGYYSAWYYIPSAAQPDPMGGYWVFSKFRSRDPSMPQIPLSELWDFDFTSQGSGLGLVVELVHLGSQRINPYVRLDSPTVPIGRWFQIESQYRPATDDSGVLKVWQDGVLIYDVEGPTAPSAFVGWSVGSMSNDLLPSTVSLYVDDVAVTRRRLGPTFPPFSGSN